jgi:hypothetical protein
VPLVQFTQLTQVANVWDEIFGTQPAPSRWLVGVTGMVALVATAPNALWRLTRNAITIAHEGGHGLVAVLTRRRLQGIRLHSDTSGLTVSRGDPHGLGMILTAAAGYTAPSLLGLLGAGLLGAGHITALLWGATVLLLAMLMMIRNWYGAMIMIVAGALFILVSWFTGPGVQAAFAYLVVWFLLLGGVRPVFELHAKRRGGRAPESDADQLARLTHTPPALWMLLFHSVALLSLVGGGQWLLQV